MGAKTEYLERSIPDLIESGELGPGGRLPSQRQLAEQLSAGRRTICLALTELGAQGIRSERSGDFVAAADDGEPANE